MAKNPQRSKGWQQFTIGMILYALIVLLEGFFLEPDTLSPVLGVVFAVWPLIAAGYLFSTLYSRRHFQ